MLNTDLIYLSKILTHCLHTVLPILIIHKLSCDIKQKPIRKWCANRFRWFQNFQLNRLWFLRGSFVNVPIWGNFFLPKRCNLSFISWGRSVQRRLTLRGASKTARYSTYADNVMCIKLAAARSRSKRSASKSHIYRLYRRSLVPVTCNALVNPERIPFQFQSALFCHPNLAYMYQIWRHNGTLCAKVTKVRYLHTDNECC